MNNFNWWERGEYAEETGDIQASADLRDTGAAYVLSVDQSIQHLFNTPLGEPPSEFDVRSVYDSRPVNAYDFNYSATAINSSTTGWAVNFNVPNGYRAVPREFEIFFDGAVSGPASNSTASIVQQGAALPNNGPIIIGAGTNERPIKTFFVCEELTTFGASGFNSNASASGTTVIVNVYGNLIATSEVALPFTIANRKFGQ